MAVRPVCVTIAVLLLQLTAYANAIDPHLEILPSGELQTKPIGSSILLTCKPKVDNPMLVDDMQWLDPQNRVIESLNPYTRGHSKPAMYTELHQDRSLSLFFNSLQEEQAGKYTCKGSYARNEQLNKSVIIDTIIAITWENAPPNQYPILGEDFAIQCHVRARPSPSVDWLYNGELIKTNERYIINTYALKIKNVQESDDGIYTCRASVQTTGELQERPIRVEVHIRPSIEEISSPVDIIEGENANIECKATGKPPPTFTWIKSLTQQNLSIADRFGVDPITGVLTITNVNREDAGEYQCTATNAAGTTTANIQVNVIVKPKIMEFVNKTVVEGSNTEIMCKAFGRPPPEIAFRKFTSDSVYVLGVQRQDDRIIMTNKAEDVSGETVGTLSINNALTSDDGLYECVAKNRGGVAYKNGHVTVEFPPTFRSMSNKTFLSWEQRPVNLTCIAESIPNATIRWTWRGDQRVDDQVSFQVLGNGPISILEVRPVDHRFYTTYKCIAANPHGTREILIDLKEGTKPSEILKANMVELTATTIRFDIIPPTEQEPPVTTISVQYKMNDQTWYNAKNRTWSVGSVYVLEGLVPQTPYEFRFAAMNDVGLGTWGANLYQMTPGKTVPTQPQILTTAGSEYEQSAFSNQYELSWKAPFDNGEPIDEYLIKYCQIKRVTGAWEVLDNTCETIRSPIRTRQYLKGLRSDSFYSVELSAHNIMGYSKPGYAKFRTNRGTDASVLQHQGPLLTSGAVIGIVVAMLFIIFIIIDAIFCCMRKTGIIYIICERSRRKPVDEEDTKLGSLYGWRFPLPYCDQKMANVAGVTAIPDSGSGKNTIRLVRHTAIDEKEPLKEEKKITPIIDSGLRRETSITFDGKRSISKTGFVGKDSAV
ncbi:fasciclin-2 isoform X2 [Nylanderia fulva]|uniref:fasciclin-2 isoform X2 n=1 Tax=Nylanderia fulva TaxID=613905 RepID=UPI0010FB3FC8|nr:fasciclin-2 isoform X2 [Nylanderia fulva]